MKNISMLFMTLAILFGFVAVGAEASGDSVLALKEIFVSLYLFGITICLLILDNNK